MRERDDQSTSQTDLEHRLALARTFGNGIDHSLFQFIVENAVHFDDESADSTSTEDSPSKPRKRFSLFNRKK